MAARPINRKELEEILIKAGFTKEQREAAHAANEGRKPEKPQSLGHGAPAPQRISMRSF